MLTRPGIFSSVAMHLNATQHDASRAQWSALRTSGWAFAVVVALYGTTNRAHAQAQPALADPTNAPSDTTTVPIDANVASPDAAEREPENAQHFIELGDAYAEAHRNADARGAYVRALKLSPRNARAMAGLRGLSQSTKPLPQVPGVSIRSTKKYYRGELASTYLGSIAVVLSLAVATRSPFPYVLTALIPGTEHLVEGNLVAGLATLLVWPIIAAVSTPLIAPPFYHRDRACGSWPAISDSGDITRCGNDRHHPSTLPIVGGLLFIAWPIFDILAFAHVERTPSEVASRSPRPVPTGLASLRFGLTTPQSGDGVALLMAGAL